MHSHFSARRSVVVAQLMARDFHKLLGSSLDQVTAANFKRRERGEQLEVLKP